MIKLKIANYAQEVSSDSWQDSLLNVSLVFGFFAFLIVIYCGYMPPFCRRRVRFIYCIIFIMSFGILINMRVTKPPKSP